MKLPKFRMPFEPMTIDHLGLRLYSTLPPVISELVSNAYDAEAPKVEIVLPRGEITPETEVIVRDYGHGLDPTEIQDEYLPIGRNRRDPDSQHRLSKNGKRVLTGRKGLGKLSTFGVGKELQLRAFQGGASVCLLLNYDHIKKWGVTNPREPYEPVVLDDLCGPSDEPDGVEIILKGLYRKTPISEDQVRQGLARRLAIISPEFEVIVNGTAVSPEDKVRQDQCVTGQSWDVSDLPNGVDIAGHKIAGWLGFYPSASQTNRGVDIFASGKAVELNSFFNFPSTHAQFARAHLVGILNADFLDQEYDLVATGRNSVVWEHEIGQALQAWGHETLKWVFERWVELRRDEKEKTISNVAGFRDWLEGRGAPEKRVAKRMLNIIVKDDNIDPKSAEPLLEIVKSSVESVYFHDLVDRIEKEGSNPATLLQLFDEWRIIEAREHLKIADGRLSAIEQLDQFVHEGALEVQQLQPLFEKHPWLIDPTWHEVHGQTRYTEMLRKHCVEPSNYEDVDRRIDILGIRIGGTITVVELKRTDRTLSRLDLEQIEKYVDWARGQFVSSGTDAARHVVGLLIVGAKNRNNDVVAKEGRLAGDDIRVEIFPDLLHRASSIYGEADRNLKSVAPEFSRTRRKELEKTGEAN